ncbi:flagellar hook-basal body protein [Acetivibrio mesophilus]|jgi:flagellar basal-body rod protein FlgF|uniref:Flagellar hook-basal body protein n=1 Tax=Acetivibrio mesophilus TaxID=2487273 RepID=A0A4Q0I6D9_9FIRM|nr:flagellar hook-basal body protein [Acetivibrio mesophilus]ODM27425.1 flagellar biosynthesis protein FlgG [Clostridium sp. Bc-iso-3]RXE59385.1 flagellar hook-basal body protein [Acetivibrio mesophilus]
MIRGLYTSGWSMLANSKQMDVVSNNLANVNTAAYKKDTVILESFPDALVRRVNDRSSSNPSGRLGNVQLGNDVGEVFTYYNQGQLQKTDNSFDMAIENCNTAFFTVAVPAGNGAYRECYTRDGSFTLNSNRQLVTKEGYPVMGQNGVITINSEDFSVSDDGSIVENGQIVDRLLIRNFTDATTLRKMGSNLVERTENTQEQQFDGIVRQGYLEQSNVNSINEMINMITIMRSYEANQKIFQAQDGTLEKAVNEIGVVR